MLKAIPELRRREGTLSRQVKAPEVKDKDGFLNFLDTSCKKKIDKTIIGRAITLN